jgi:hypothetical protein
MEANNDFFAKYRSALMIKVLESKMPLSLHKELLQLPQHLQVVEIQNILGLQTNLVLLKLYKKIYSMGIEWMKTRIRGNSNIDWMLQHINVNTEVSDIEFVNLLLYCKAYDKNIGQPSHPIIFMLKESISGITNNLIFNLLPDNMRNVSQFT